MREREDEETIAICAEKDALFCYLCERRVGDVNSPPPRKGGEESCLSRRSLKEKNTNAA